MVVEGQAQRRSTLLDDTILGAACGPYPHLLVVRIPQGIQPLEARTLTRCTPRVEPLAPAEVARREGRPARCSNPGDRFLILWGNGPYGIHSSLPLP
jgi:hypothetical protein